MVSPLLDGAKPMLELMMARSISPMSFFSHGVIAIVRASGVVTVAQLASGDIERAIINSNIGLAPSNNGETIRLILPPLTEERRRELCKQCKGEAESAKMSIRNARRDAIEEFKKLVKNGLSEDIEKDAEEEMQKTHDKYIAKVEALYAAKEKEIMTV